MIYTSFRPNKERANAAIVLIGILLLIQLIGAASSLMQLKLLERLALGEMITDAASDENDTREQIIAIVNTVLMVFSGIVFISLFRRAYNNLGVLSGNTRYAEG